MTIQVCKVADGATAAFEYDSRLVAALKGAFPKARWSAGSKHWHVPGKLAHGRLTKWADAQAAAMPTAEDEQRARDALAIEPIPSKRVHVAGPSIVITTPYSETLVRLLKVLPGARWADKDAAGLGRWIMPCSSAPALRKALPEIEAECDRVDVIAAALKATRDAAYAADRAHQEKRREAADKLHAERRANRILVLLHAAPCVGDTIRRSGNSLVVTDLGKVFRVDEDMPSVWGSSLLGHEGEQCCYAYTRPATQAECAALEAREVDAARAAAAQAARFAAADAARRAIVVQGTRPAASEIAPLDGEVLHSHRADLAIFGGGERVILASDGALWLVRGNGADGDDWSRSDQSGGIGYRVPPGPAADALVERFRALRPGQ